MSTTWPRHRGDQRPRLRQPDARRRLAGRARSARWRRPARRTAQQPAGRADRLLRAQRRQGDARRPPAQHHHRRRAGARARAPRSRRRPAEPRRRLGHAVRDAHRAPARRRRGLGRRARSWTATSTRSTRRPAASSTPTPSSPTARGGGWCCCRPATPDTLPLWRELVDDVEALLRPHLRTARRHPHRRRPRRREHLQRRCSPTSATSSSAPASPSRATARCASSSTGFTGREGEPLPLIVRKSDGGYGYAHHRPRRRSGTGSATSRADRVLYVIGAPQALHLAMVFETAARRPAGSPDASRSCTCRSARPRRRTARSCAPARGAPCKLIDLLDEAVERRRRGRRRGPSPTSTRTRAPRSRRRSASAR